MYTLSSLFQHRLHQNISYPGFPSLKYTFEHESHIHVKQNVYLICYIMISNTNNWGCLLANFFKKYITSFLKNMSLYTPKTQESKDEEKFVDNETVDKVYEKLDDVCVKLSGKEFLALQMDMFNLLAGSENDEIISSQNKLLNALEDYKSGLENIPENGKRPLTQSALYTIAYRVIQNMIRGNKPSYDKIWTASEIIAEQIIQYANGN